MNFNKIIKDYFRLIKEGETFKDKGIILVYFVQMPIRQIIKRFRKNYAMRLISNVSLKNKDGRYFCGDNIFAAWCCSTLGEENVSSNIVLNSGVFVDVGANVGKYTVKLGNQLKNKGTVIAVEPEPVNFKALQKNVKLNNLENVFLENVACSDSNGFAEFYIDVMGNYGGAHSLIKKTKNKIKVKTRRLDHIIDKLKMENIDLIKIDVEGAEANVLKGASNVLKKYHPKIIFESWNKKQLETVKNVLKPFNYKIEKIDKENYLAC